MHVVRFLLHTVKECGRLLHTTKESNMPNNTKPPKSLFNRIKLANQYIKFAQKHDIVGEAQGGANLLRYTHPITVSPKGHNANVKLEFTQRGTDESTNYSLTDEWDVDELRWVITHSIINPIKKAAKEKEIELKIEKESTCSI